VVWRVCIHLYTKFPNLLWLWQFTLSWTWRWQLPLLAVLFVRYTLNIVWSNAYFVSDVVTSAASSPPGCSDVAAGSGGPLHWGGGVVAVQVGCIRIKSWKLQRKGGPKNTHEYCMPSELWQWEVCNGKMWVRGGGGGSKHARNSTLCTAFPSKRKLRIFN
jgi:hypothetical protein